MKLYAVTVIKNEEDIINYTLNSTLKWADKVIVLDNGSTDNTWEIVKSFKSSKVIPFMQETGPYSDGFRSRIFHAFKNEMSNGDWWVIQDGDEVYIDDPRNFLDAIDPKVHHINGNKIDFLPSDSVSNIPLDTFDRVQFRFCKSKSWSEPRLIKHRENMVWEEKNVWPKYMGLRGQKLIRIAHFPHRSVSQLRKRFLDRKESINNQGQYFSHWDVVSWDTQYPDKETISEICASEEELFDTIKVANDYVQSKLKKAVFKLLFGLRLIK